MTQPTPDIETHEEHEPDAKPCTHCGEVLPFAAFWQHNRSPDGLHYWCKTCFPIVVGEAKRLRKELLELGFKTCGHCDRTKPVAEFGNHNRTPDRLRSACKGCESAARTKAKAAKVEAPETTAPAAA